MNKQNNWSQSKKDIIIPETQTLEKIDFISSELFEKTVFLKTKHWLLQNKSS